MASQSPEQVNAPEADQRSEAVPESVRRRPGRWLDVVLLVLSALLGAAGCSYLAIAGTSLGQHLGGPRLWFFANPRSLSPHRIGLHAAVWRTYLSLAALVIAWLLVGLVLRRGTPRWWWLLGVGAAWAIPLLVGPPLFSPDAYNYTAVAAAMHHGIDPYVAGPQSHGKFFAVRGVEPIWSKTPSPYSPLLLDLLAAISWALRERMLAVLLALRALLVAALLAVAWEVTRLARLLDRPTAVPLWLVVLNPLTMVTIVSGNHVDILMVALILAGLLLAQRGRPYLGVLFVVLAAGVKVVALIAMITIVADQLWKRGSWMRRLRGAAGVALAGVGCFVLSVEVSGRGWGWLHDLSIPNRALSPMTPSVSLAILLDPRHPPYARLWHVGNVLTVVVCLLLLTQLGRWGLVRTTGWMFFAVIVFGAVVWPWYLLWPLVLFGVAGTLRERWLFGALSLVLLLGSLPGGQPALLLLPPPLAFQVVPAVLLAALLAWVATGVLQRPWIRRRLGAGPVAAT